MNHFFHINEKNHPRLILKCFDMNEHVKVISKNKKMKRKAIQHRYHTRMVNRFFKWFINWGNFCRHINVAYHFSENFHLFSDDEFIAKIINCYFNFSSNWYMDVVY